jgi:hypothetical protein
VVPGPTLGALAGRRRAAQYGLASNHDPDEDEPMFTQNLDSSAMYRTLARGCGSARARTYRTSQQDHAAQRYGERRELTRSRHLAGAGEHARKR